MVLINQIDAKNKTKKVIESCTTDDHIYVAERMVELYKDKFEDFLGYNELKRKVKKRKDELL